MYNISFINLAENLRGKYSSFISFQLELINFLLDQAQTHLKKL